MAALYKYPREETLIKRSSDLGFFQDRISFVFRTSAPDPTDEAQGHIFHILPMPLVRYTLLKLLGIPKESRRRKVAKQIDA
jgi:hypothetical protein